MNTALTKTVIRRSAGLVLILTLALAAPGNAQLGTLNAIGYGAAGATLGLLATSGAECTSSWWEICIPTEMAIAGLGGLAAGMILGGKLGGSAEASVERGEPVNNLWAVTTGAALGGALLGVVVGLWLLDSDPGSGTILGSDEQTTAILAVGGAGLATLYLWSRWDELTGKTLEVMPAIVGGEAGLTARIRF